jgi:hypothetical protein
MTEMTAGTVALDEPRAAQPGHATGPVFLSQNGRRGRVLTVAGCVAAAGAALWIVALVAGVLGVATPGLIHLPGVRTDAPSGSAAQGPGGGVRPRVVTRRLPANARTATSVARPRAAAPATARRRPDPTTRPPARLRATSRRAVATAPRPSATTPRPQNQAAGKASTATPPPATTSPRRSTTHGTTASSTAHATAGGSTGQAVRATRPASSGAAPTSPAPAADPRGVARGHVG